MSIGVRFAKSMNDASNISRGGFVLDGVGHLHSQSIVVPRRSGSAASFFRSAANFSKGFFQHIGGLSWFRKAEGLIHPGSPPF
jgi:hypothetical protein